MAVRTISVQDRLWYETGNDAAGADVPAPALNGICGAPAPGATMRAEPGRPLLIRYGKHLRGIFDALIARFSLVANDPVLDARDFAWTTALREQ